MKKTSLTLILGLTATFLLTGCETTLVSMTPSQLPQNPSNIYAIEMEPQMLEGNTIKDSMRPRVVIDGHEHAMKRVSETSNRFRYEYRVPEDQHEAKYYFSMHYNVDVDGNLRERQAHSDLYTLELINRYIVSMESDRGVVGSQIAVLGRGFDKADTITINGIPAPTTWQSPHAIAFTVPALPAGQSYPIELVNEGSSLKIGEFLVDSSKIRLNTEQLQLSPEERSILVFHTDYPAPAGGLAIDVTTDIPDSIIMPPVTIPEGQKTISVMLEAGSPDNGTLFITAPGFEEVELPVSIES